MIRRILIANHLSAGGPPLSAPRPLLRLLAGQNLTFSTLAPREELASREVSRACARHSKNGGCSPKATARDVERQLGVAITKVEVHGGDDPVSRIADYVSHHAPDLRFAASHGRAGQSFWGHGSIAVSTMRETALSCVVMLGNADGCEVIKPRCPHSFANGREPSLQ